MFNTYTNVESRVSYINTYGTDISTLLNLPGGKNEPQKRASEKKKRKHLPVESISYEKHQAIANIGTFVHWIKRNEETKQAKLMLR